MLTVISTRENTMQSITIVLRAKQLINASKQSNVTTCHSVIQDLLGNNPVMWPVSSLPWVIAGLIHCMDRLPLSTLDTIMPSVFELFAKLLDNEWSHPIMIKGLRLAHRPPDYPNGFWSFHGLSWQSNAITIIPRHSIWPNGSLPYKAKATIASCFRGCYPFIASNCKP